MAAELNESDDRVTKATVLQHLGEEEANRLKSII